MRLATRVAALLLLIWSGAAWAGEGLQAGAARVDVTPAAEALPPFLGILDPLYARAIVVENAGVRGKIAWSFGTIS